MHAEDPARIVTSLKFPPMNKSLTVLRMYTYTATQVKYDLLETPIRHMARHFRNCPTPHES